MNKRIIFAFVAMLLVLAGALTLYFYSKRIPMDPSNHGNTAANLQNGGLFFEMDGKVYFSNASDNDCLYSMDIDESHPKRMTTMGVRYINGADGILYFYMASTKKSSNVTGLGAATNQYGIYRCKADGSDQTCLHREFCGEVQLCGEYLYYQNLTGNNLSKIRCDKKDQGVVYQEKISPVCYDNGTIFYSGLTTDHNIHTYDLSSGRIGTILQGSCFMPVINNGYLYYLNGTSNYSLWRMNLTTGEQQLVSSDRMDTYTLNDQFIYYSFSNSDAPALKRCNLDGSNTIVLYNGIVNSINLTSRYVYFKLYGNDETIYHMPLDGSKAATPFEVIGK